MKAILEFNLPEEKQEYQLAANATDYAITLEEFDNYLRGKIKYDDTLTEEQCHVFEEVREKLWEFKNDNGIT